MANYNQAVFMPGSAIRVPNVYPGFPNGRLVRPPPHIANFTMTPNSGIHRNINGNAYVPNMTNMIAMNNMVNNPRFVNQMRMQAPIYKQNAGIGRLLTFVEYLGGDVMMTNLQDIQYWKSLTQSFFSEDVIMKYTLNDEINNKTKRFEFTYQVIPRFYQTFIESGVVKIQLVLGFPRERLVNTSSGGVQFQVECQSSSIEYHFANGIQVNAPGRLTVTFNNTLKMTSFDFVTLKFTEYVPRNLIPRFTPDTVVVNEFGIPHKTMRCLEIAEGVDYMQDVIALTIKDSHTGPLQALRMVKLHSQGMNQTPTISNNPNPNQRIPNPQAQLNGQKDIKNEPNYNGAPPTPNSNDLQASALTPTATPTPAPTPTPTPSLTPSPLVPNANGPQKNFSSPAISERNLKRGGENISSNKQKRRSMQAKGSPRKNA
ncbi:LIM-domain binding protein [Glomus cerebriforme]|uniref:LIM-domain binding protein n=1 Tax=Glomus cerebriforme TaxID=658196 RepID=A0A397TFN5_9GLOM|nr:LIM-domain binding protein [Glomus cerebriforme]